MENSSCVEREQILNKRNCRSLHQFIFFSLQFTVHTHTHTDKFQSHSCKQALVEKHFSMKAIYLATVGCLLTGCYLMTYLLMCVI